MPHPNVYTFLTFKSLEASIVRKLRRVNLSDSNLSLNINVRKKVMLYLCLVRTDERKPCKVQCVLRYELQYVLFLFGIPHLA